MNLAELFQPIDLADYSRDEFQVSDALMQHIAINSITKGFPGDMDIDVVILGVNEYRGTKSPKPQSNAPDKIRKAFYALKKHSQLCRLADVGNFIAGNSINDTYHALGAIVTDLLQRNIIPVIIGGSQDLTYAHYLGYANLEQAINITGVDPAFDLGTPEDELNDQTYIGKIVLSNPNYLFNFSNLGYQTYYVGQEQVHLMEKLFFDAYRLGLVREDLKETEPIIRNADMISFDMTSIRQSDAPSVLKPSPNGFYGEEACQMMYYAGMNDRLTGAGLYNLNPDEDHHDQTSGLAAQMIWYFLEGFANRKMDLPVKSQQQNFTVYRVPLPSYKDEIVFLKSKKTERWWIELPSENKNRLLKSHFLPCSYKDYEQACSDEIPDRWWQALQKIS
ncbi:MAG: formimidoylglutamase [Bacteroidia bacterium]|nr:formimidoylglutamase [Bacteroidia bacterium]MCZ2276734.1 formimidoylglutamase [Bacteroidia bacterium]